jgi:hypothetical protein
MGEHVSWQVELAVKPGQLESFRGLTREMVEFTKSEAGVLVYERYVSGDARSIFVYERYTDSSPQGMAPDLQVWLTEKASQYLATRAMTYVRYWINSALLT